MRIGIDARMIGLENVGIGRYIENLVENLLRIDKKNQYLLFVRKNKVAEIKSKFNSLNPKLEIIEADVSHYSLKEQLLLPYLINKAKPDFMHFPHFNVPIFYFGPYLVTIHDLIKHSSRGLATTTRHPWLYWLKYLGYLLTFWLAVRRARKILVPSKTIGHQLIETYKLKEQKIIVTYEGVGKQFRIDPSSPIKINEILKKHRIKKPFLLYVGSVYPHKNIPVLVKAIKILNQIPITDHQSLITLVIVCGRSVFWKRLEKEISNLESDRFVNLTGFIPDEELVALYQEAEAYLFPSLSEGFGLPGLEAMAVGLPVLASNIPVFKEVYQKAAQFFDPLDSEDIAQKIKDLLTNQILQKNLTRAGFELVKQFSWEKMAKETLDEYLKV